MQSYFLASDTAILLKLSLNICKAQWQGKPLTTSLSYLVLREHFSHYTLDRTAANLSANLADQFAAVLSKFFCSNSNGLKVTWEVLHLFPNLFVLKIHRDFVAL